MAIPEMIDNRKEKTILNRAYFNPKTVKETSIIYGLSRGAAIMKVIITFNDVRFFIESINGTTPQEHTGSIAA